MGYVLYGSDMCKAGTQLAIDEANRKREWHKVKMLFAYVGIYVFSVWYILSMLQAIGFIDRSIIIPNIPLP